MLGKLLDGRYEIIKVLGAGGFGETYLAHDIRRPGKPLCVVKRLNTISTDTNFLLTARRLFKSEAETQEKLGHHRQIPRLLAYFEENKELMFQSIYQHVQKHIFTWKHNIIECCYYYYYRTKPPSIIWPNILN